MTAPLHMPLAVAYLCQDCSHIGNCSRTCPACASEVLMNLAAILNREPEPLLPAEEKRVA
jgi:hypothetical protein